jgi:periplasmic protein TonB
MSRPTAATSEPAPRRRTPLRSRAWLWIALAFAAGLVLFSFVLLRDDDRDDFFRADAPGPQAGAPDYTPLPAPLPGDGGVGLARSAAPVTGPDGDARLVETRPPPVPTMPRSEPRAAASVAGHVDPQPLPDQSPAPRYPTRALRRGEQGVVNVRASIGPDGVPTSVSLVSGSGSRDLDRAALDAVRRWRFRPAVEDGRPTVGTVVVPIEFSRE